MTLAHETLLLGKRAGSASSPLDSLLCHIFSQPLPTESWFFHNVKYNVGMLVHCNMSVSLKVSKETIMIVHESIKENPFRS